MDDSTTGVPQFLSGLVGDLLALVLAPLNLALDPAQETSWTPSDGAGAGLSVVGAPLWGPAADPLSHGAHAFVGAAICSSFCGAGVEGRPGVGGRSKSSG